MCINDCLQDKHPFNLSKNTSRVKTQVIRNEKLEMTAPGANGSKSWASNEIPPTEPLSIIKHKAPPQGTLRIGCQPTEARKIQN